MKTALTPHPRRAVWIGYCIEAGWSPAEIAEAFDQEAGTGEGLDDGEADEDDVTDLELV